MEFHKRDAWPDSFLEKSNGSYITEEVPLNIKSPTLLEQLPIGCWRWVLGGVTVVSIAAISSADMGIHSVGLSSFFSSQHVLRAWLD
jgi:hypothetical protein